jgi:quercetin dioxygenase-like cupin family protein
MDDGSEEEFAVGDVWIIPPGHDAWVVGDETFVVLEFSPAAAS